MNFELLDVSLTCAQMSWWMWYQMLPWQNHSESNPYPVVPPVLALLYAKLLRRKTLVQVCGREPGLPSAARLRAAPKGEMQVNQTCCSELKFHDLSPAPFTDFLCLLSSIRCLFDTMLLSSNGDNHCVIDFFLCRIHCCQASTGFLWHGYWFVIGPAHWRG